MKDCKYVVLFFLQSEFREEIKYEINKNNVKRIQEIYYSPAEDCEGI